MWMDGKDPRRYGLPNAEFNTPLSSTAIHAMVVQLGDCDKPSLEFTQLVKWLR